MDSKLRQCSGPTHQTASSRHPPRPNSSDKHAQPPNVLAGNRPSYVFTGTRPTNWPKLAAALGDTEPSSSTIEQQDTERPKTITNQYRSTDQQQATTIKTWTIEVDFFSTMFHDKLSAIPRAAEPNAHHSIRRRRPAAGNLKSTTSSTFSGMFHTRPSHNAKTQQRYAPRNAPQRKNAIRAPMGHFAPNTDKSHMWYFIT